MTDRPTRVELTSSFLARLESIEEFLAGADAHFAYDADYYDDLPAELRATVFPNLRRFPRMGRRYLEQPPRSAEALTLLAQLPAGAADALREYLSGDYLILCTEFESTVNLLSIRHHRQLSFKFASS